MTSFPGQATATSPRASMFTRPRLTIVPKMAARAPRIPFVALVVTLLVAGLVGLLLLNTGLQQGAYDVTRLQQTSADLTLRQQNLQLSVDELSSPQRISERALRLGMVTNDSPAFLSLESGKIVGIAVPGVAAHRPRVTLRPTVDVRPQTKPAPLFAGEANSATTGVTKIDDHRDKQPETHHRKQHR